MVNPWRSRRVSVVRLLFFRGEYMILPRCVLGVSMICSWCFRGGSVPPPWSMVPMWWVRGASVVFPWYRHDSMVLTSCVYGVSMMSPRCFRGGSVVPPWSRVAPWWVHGASAGLVWCPDSVMSPWCFITLCTWAGLSAQIGTSEVSR